MISDDISIQMYMALVEIDPASLRPTVVEHAQRTCCLLYSIYLAPSPKLTVAILDRQPTNLAPLAA